ncbi:hypothetical protein [Streptosporangium sp. NPDC051022]|uniref:hypothetical protein n=1 Tax=Streptosporangium sp. NPDC051022 TaxID=3155752 RepID=UPI003435347E
MHPALLLSLFTMTMASGPGDDNGAYPWGGGWVVYGDHGAGRPGTPARRGGKHAGTSPWSGCHSLPGPNGIRYVQCDNGPGTQNDLFEGVVPGDSAAPAVTPEMLLQEALRQLRPPVPVVGTAPPRGREGLVGLRHFFWADRSQWHTISKRATAGPVWAEVTATPNHLVINPGSRQSSVTCQGPGTPYDPSKKPEAQKSDCSHLFTRSSAGLPGSQYRVTVSVVWTATWSGSGGAGGTLAPITTSTAFPLRVAEGQALIQRSS